MRTIPRDIVGADRFATSIASLAHALLARNTRATPLQRRVCNACSQLHAAPAAIPPTRHPPLVQTHVPANHLNDPPPRPFSITDSGSSRMTHIYPAIFCPARSLISMIEAAVLPLSLLFLSPQSDECYITSSPYSSAVFVASTLAPTTALLPFLLPCVSLWADVCVATFAPL